MDGKPLVSQFEDDLTKVVKQYMGEGLSCAEVIGTVELIKLQIYDHIVECEQEDKERFGDLDFDPQDDDFGPINLNNTEPDNLN